MSLDETRRLGWDSLDVLLVTGDAYVDHPSFGAAIIARVLLDAGYRVGIIAQPDWTRPESLSVMGRPRLACAVTSGNMDSMVNLYAASRRLRERDAYSPDGKTGLRPPRSLTVYANLARQAFPGLPVILGGVEASTRRLAHYDYWQDRIRPSVLLDTKAESLVFGMGERAMAELVNRLDRGAPLEGVPGTASLLGRNRASAPLQENWVELPAFETIRERPVALIEAQKILESEMDPTGDRRLFQRHGDRAVLMAPPAAPLTSEEMDRVYELPYAGRPHPSYRAPIPAYEMIRWSITCVRGCPGGCAFCALGIHQGRVLTSRSETSVLKEIEKLTKRPGFTGQISDIGGPTANAYGHRCDNVGRSERCRRASCLFPKRCPSYRIDEGPMTRLLKAAGKVRGVRDVFIGSGIRLDLAREQPALTREIIANHVSGHLKVAPEHVDDRVLRLMRKNPRADFVEFLRVFQQTSSAIGKEQYIVPYFMANYPGCDDAAMAELDRFLRESGWTLRQSQDFIPLPMTMAAAMYYAGTDPEGRPIVVNRGLRERRAQTESLKRDRSQSRRSPPSKPFKEKQR